ncbi:DUF262 domain-containing protein [Campylobacter lanienae]|uniref:DUF262 domain-containing protein n=1 Tax=Campylobacter lanienae TaxID=75658 RepID=UPI0015D72675|nr:DUF262 domain-containing protein [Campylobacter lanienae]
MQTKVSDVFSSSNLFSIPNYQRDYAWGAHNITELWEDLEEAKALSEDKNNSNEMGHFLGTIVLAKRDDGVYDIIDGQQRATTIYLLRYALNALKNNKDRNINIFLDDDDKPRLQVTKQNSDFFAKLLKQANDKQIYDSLEKEAITSGQKSYMKFLKKFGLRLAILLTKKQVATY